MAGKLTTHTLDIHQGRPAGDVLIKLYRLEENERRILIKTLSTNTDGRTDVPLLGPEEMKVGCYELVFAVGAYFAKAGVALSTPSFLDDVPVRFAVADASLPYHIPLLFSPWAYSTYRGS